MHEMSKNSYRSRCRRIRCPRRSANQRPSCSTTIRTIVWEYWRYPKGLWVGYLLHCPFHPYCYIPAEPRNPYYVAFRKDHVCLWGTPDLVRTLIEQVCIADSTSQTVRSDGRARRSSISVVPVFMRVPIALPLQRLAILRIGGEANPQVAMVRSDAKFSPFAPSPGHVC